jgi:hypothetical protein
LSPVNGSVFAAEAICPDELVAHDAYNNEQWTGTGNSSASPRVAKLNKKKDRKLCKRYLIPAKALKRLYQAHEQPVSEQATAFRQSSVSTSTVRTWLDPLANLNVPRPAVAGAADDLHKT